MIFVCFSKKTVTIFLFLLVCFSPIYFYAQTEINKDPILTVVDEMPSFPGGEQEMINFLTQNLRYPSYEAAAHIQGKCFLSFVVEKDGTITNINILKGIPNGNGCSQEAIRVVKLMPKWVPGKKNNEIVRVQYNLPVNFKLKSIDSITQADTIYFEKAQVKSSKERALSYRIISKQKDHYLVTDRYMKTNVYQMVAVCSELDPLHKDGPCTYFYEDGKKRSEGNYSNDKRIGKWTYWYNNGTDSSVIDFSNNGDYKYIQAANIPLNDSSVLEYPEVFAEFPGGQKAMSQFIVQHINYPTVERKNHIGGMCYLTFIVEKDGTLSDIKILKGVANGPGYDKEALRVIRLMPKWRAGAQFGKLIRVRYNLPIAFVADPPQKN